MAEGGGGTGGRKVMMIRDEVEENACKDIRESRPWKGGGLCA